MNLHEPVECEAGETSPDGRLVMSPDRRLERQPLVDAGVPQPVEDAAAKPA
jgi:hypothetical protein